ncbi:hypothetical protein RHOSPDRAFT_25088 [Rhodotorula sp. JG-1b]|nr:hypothetical protein RHOSPDRAFT_25088 [Rhodotorula sp. JG-1b]
MDTKLLLQRQKQTAFALGRGCAFVVNHPRASQLSAMEEAFRSRDAPPGLILLDVGEKAMDPTYAVFGSDEWAAHAQASLSAHPLVVDGVEISFSTETRPSAWPTDRSLLHDRPDRRCWLRPELNLHSADSFAPDGFLRSCPEASEHWARTTSALKDESAGYWVDETLVAAFDRMQIDPSTVTSDTTTPWSGNNITRMGSSPIQAGCHPATPSGSHDLATERPAKRSRTYHEEATSGYNSNSYHGAPQDRYTSTMVHIFGEVSWQATGNRLGYQDIKEQNRWLEEVLTLDRDVPIIYIPYQRLNNKQYLIAEYHSPSVAKAVVETHYGARLLSYQNAPLTYALFSYKAPSDTVVRCNAFPPFSEAGGHPTCNMTSQIINELVQCGSEYPICAVKIGSKKYGFGSVTSDLPPPRSRRLLVRLPLPVNPPKSSAAITQHYVRSIRWNLSVQAHCDLDWVGILDPGRRKLQADQIKRLPEARYV